MTRCTRKRCPREAAPDRHTCDPCLGAARARYTRRVDGGRCARCSAPPLPGLAHCREHLDGARERERQRRAEGAHHA